MQDYHILFFSYSFPFSKLVSNMKLEMTKYLPRSSYSTKMYCVNFYTFVLNVCCHFDNVTKHCAVFYVIFD